MAVDAAILLFAPMLALGAHLLVSLALSAKPALVTADFVHSYLWRYLANVWIPLLCGLPLLALHGVYSHGRAYRSRYKILVLLQAASLTYLLYALIVYLIPSLPTVPRTVFIGSWLATTGMLLGARFLASVWTEAYRLEERFLRRQHADRPVRRVLVIGGAGYIGSIVVRRLLDEGYIVRVLDMLLYGDEAIRELYGNPRFELTRGDFRQIHAVVAAMQDMDAVIHLGAIVGDPACALAPEVTVQTNLAATRVIADAAVGFGVRRLVFASTCSVYGASDHELDEKSEVVPLSLYAETKVASERILLSMTSPTFSPVVLRLATVHGMSPRPRFDLVVNLLSAMAKVEGRIRVIGGDQWRPFLHVADAAEAFVACLEAPDDAVAGQTLNVGATSENWQIQDIATHITELLPGTEVVAEDISPDDKRNYRVRFDMIEKRLGFVPQRTLRTGIREIIDAIAAGQIEDFRDAKYSNHRFLSDPGARAAVQLEDTAFDLAWTSVARPDGG